MRTRRSLRRLGLLAIVLAAVVAIVGPASGLTSLAVTLSSTAAGASQVRYVLTSTAEAALAAGSGTITVSMPAGTVLPGLDDRYVVRNVTTGQEFGAGFGNPVTLSDGGATATFITPVAIDAGDEFSVAVHRVSNAATAGSYSVALSTSAEPVPQSGAFSLTAGQALESVTSTVSSNAAGATRVRFTIHATASSSGALVPLEGRFTVSGPPGTALPLLDGWYQVRNLTSGQQSAVGIGNPVTLTDGGATATFATPIAIAAGDELEVLIDRVTNSSNLGPAQLGVRTTSDTAPVSVPFSLVASQSISDLTVSPSSPTAGAAGVRYTIGFSPSPSGAIVANHGTITVAAPAGTALPSLDGAYVVHNLTTGQQFAAGIGNPVAIADGGATATFTTPVAIGTGDDVEVLIDGVTNAPSAGSAQLGLSTSSDTVHATAGLTLTGGGTAVEDLAVSISDPYQLAPSTYTLSFVLSPTGGLAAVTGTVTVAAPAGTQLPALDGSYHVRDLTTGQQQQAGIGNPVTLDDDGATATFAVPFALSPGHEIEVTVSGVINPTATGELPLALSTSSDTAPASTPVEILAGAPVSGRVSFNGTPMPHAPVQICPTTGDSCRLTITDDNGDYVLGAPTGAIMVTAYTFAYSSSPAAPTSAGPLTVVGATPLTVDLELDPANPVPAAVTIDGQTGANVQVNWGGPLEYQTQGCANGVGVLVITGTTRLDQPETRIVHLIETPRGSGTYEAVIPALYPIHGFAELAQGIWCLSETAVLPNGGPETGGTELTIIGADFTGATSVTFGGVPALSFDVVDDGRIVAVAPPGTGTVDIVISTPQGQTGPDPIGRYTYMAVTDVSPTNAASGETVTVTGRGLTNASVVFFGEFATPRFVVVNDTTVLVEVPPGSGSGGIRVGAPGRISAIDGPLFTFSGGPLARVTPKSATPDRRRTLQQFDVDSAWESACGGFNIVLHFGECAGIGPQIGFFKLIGPPFGVYIDPSGTIVNQNGGPVAGATATLLRSSAQAGPFTALPAGSPFMQPSINPQVTGADGMFKWDVLAGWYKVRATAPDCAAPGNSGEPVVETPALPVPPPQIGLVLELECSNAPPASPPAIAALTPALGPAAGGTTVSIVGSHFSGASAVAFGDTPAVSFTVLGPGSIVAEAPPGTGSAQVSVTTPHGTSNGGASFRYVGAPVVDAVSPTHGPGTGGSTVTITGSGLASTASVRFGGQEAAFFVDSDNQLIAVAPAGTGSVGVLVGTPGCAPELPADTTACGPSNTAGYEYESTTIPPEFTSEAPPASGTVGTPYSFAFTADGEPAPSFALDSGVLPDGLSLGADGVLSGTPTTPGAFTFTVEASNSAGAATAGPFTITIVAPLADVVEVSFTAGLTYANAGAITSGNLEIARNSSGRVTSVRGHGTLPGAVGGTATVWVNVSRVAGLYVGTVRVKDPGATLDVTTAVLTRSLQSIGANGVQDTASGLVRKGRRLVGYKLRWEVTDNT